ncbi:MAG: hypothetical protein ABL308_13290 [Oceanicaulis sp.]
MTRLFLTIIMALVAALFIGGARSAHSQDCDAYIQSLQEVTGSSTFDPFESVDYGRVVRLTVANDGTDDCQLRLRALNPAMGARLLTGAGLPYALFDPTNGLLDNDPGTVTGAFDFSVGANATRDILITLVIERPQFAVPATETTLDELIVSDQASGQEYDRIDLSLSVDIVSRAQINLAGVDAPYDRDFAINQISFGSLEPGIERTVYLQIRANEDVAVQFQSNNGGTLNEVGGGSGRVPYSAYLAGAYIELIAPQSLAQPAPVSLDGLSLPLTFRIEPFGIQPSNRYRDRVTITVTALPG